VNGPVLSSVETGSTYGNIDVLNHRPSNPQSDTVSNMDREQSVVCQVELVEPLVLQQCSAGVNLTDSRGGPKKEAAHRLLLPSHHHEVWNHRKMSARLDQCEYLRSWCAWSLTGRKENAMFEGHRHRARGKQTTVEFVQCRGIE
jgi:hypothetical protein